MTYARQNADDAELPDKDAWLASAKRTKRRIWRIMPDWMREKSRYVRFAADSLHVFPGQFSRNAFRNAHFLRFEAAEWLMCMKSCDMHVWAEAVS